MNLQQYGTHRKALGLRGTSHVAVLNAINDGRLSAPAVRRQGRNWEINPELADQQWADATHPAERGSGHHRGQEPAAASAPSQRQDAAMPKGVPPRAVSEAVLAAVKAKRETLALHLEENRLVYREDMEAAQNAVNLQILSRAEALPKQIKLDIPHLTLEEMAVIERRVLEIFESVSAHDFEELPE